MSRRTTTNRRGIKKRSLIPSFGDIVLPVVGVAAVGLLVLAGRQFFASGMKSSPGMTSTQAYMDSPAIMAERERKYEPAPEISRNEPEISQQEENISEGTVLAVEQNPAAPSIADVKPAVSQAVPKTTSSAKTSQASPAPAKAAAKSPVKMTNLPPEKQWRVQVGAYPSRAEAENVVKKINRAGYKARVYHNPDSKHVKVWVEAGESKYQAGLMVEAMKKLGYKSSFSFPPMK